MNKSFQSGFTLIEVLIGLGILMIIGAQVLSSFKQNITVTKAIIEKGELEDLRRLVRLKVGCRNTLLAAPASCPTEEPVNILSYNYNIIIPSTSGMYGRYRVRGTCVDNGGIKSIRMYFLQKGDYVSLFKDPGLC